MPPKSRRVVKEEALPPEAVDFDPKAFFDMNTFLVDFLKQVGHDIAANVDVEFKRSCMESYKDILEIKSEFKELCEEVSGKRSVPKTPKRSALSKISTTIALFDDVVQSAAEAEQLQSVPLPEPESQEGEIPPVLEVVPQQVINCNDEQMPGQSQLEDLDQFHSEPVDTAPSTVAEAEPQSIEAPSVSLAHDESKEVTPAPSVRKTTGRTLRSRVKEEPMELNCNEGSSDLPELGQKQSIVRPLHQSSSSRSRRIRPSETVTIASSSADAEPVKVKEEVLSPIVSAEIGAAVAAKTQIPRIEERAFAGKTTPIRSRYAHQHVVSTPGKVGRKDHVQKVIAEQDRVRMRSPLRKPVVSQILPENNRKFKEDNESRKHNIELKLQQAAQNKKILELERAERLRKVQEEKQLRVKLNVLRNEETKKKEKDQKKVMREERVKSPSRLPISRVASPSRCKLLQQNPATPRVISKKLFVNSPARTPGRGPVKASKVTLLSGESSREGTYSSPAREVKRKLRPKEECEDVDSMCAASNQEFNGNPSILQSEERQRIETARELREVHDFEVLEREQHRKQQEKILLNKQLEKEQRDKEQRAREVECRAQELQKRHEETIRLQDSRLLEEMKENRNDEAPMEKQSVRNQMDLNNKHLADVSLTASTDSSYPLTPEKTYEPASLTNYNIEDLSSGDETDDDTAPRKKVPAWADWNSLKRMARRQHNISKCYNVYGPPIHPESCTVFAKGTAKLKKRRGSSAQWNSPLEKPSKGKSRFLGF